MGICGSTSLEDQLSRQIDRDLSRAHRSSRDVTKMLLLGAGGSGKSTVMRQFKMLYTSGFGDAERIHMRDFIRKNIVQGIQLLVQATRDHSHETTHIAPINHPHIDSVFQLDPTNTNNKWSTEISCACIELFKDPAVVFAEEMSSKLQLEDSIRYFRQHLQRVCSLDYIPTDIDIAHVRIRTTGVHPMSFQVNQAKFLCVDVGGQRNERRKWISQFDNVDVVVFVASIAAFDMTLIEERTKNRFMEALELFEELCHSPYFRSTDIILFLNKKDLLEEKLNKGVQVSDHFPDYTGDNTYDDVVTYFKSMYEQAFCRAQDVMLGNNIEYLDRYSQGRLDGLPSRFSDLEATEIEKKEIEKHLEEQTASTIAGTSNKRRNVSLGDANEAEKIGRHRGRDASGGISNTNTSMWSSAPRTGGIGLNSYEKEGVRNKQMYIHVTHATDSENIEFTFDACQQIILKSNIMDSGLM